MRDTRIDLLRLLLIGAVVCLHTFCVSDTSQYPFIDALSSMLNVVFHNAVPMFVMISGIALMKSHSDMPLMDFYKRRMFRLLVPLVPISLFYVGVRLLRDHEPWRVVFFESIQGAPYYHLWFAFMLLAVYALMPLLIRCVKEIPSYLVVPVASFFVCLGLLQGEGPWHVVPFAGYAVIGMVIYRAFGNTGDGKIKWLPVLLLGTGFLAVESVVVCLYMAKGCGWIIGYCSPLILVGSAICLTLWLKGTAGSVRPFSGSRYVYGVYLIHPICKGLASAVISRLFPDVASLLLLFPVTLLISFAVVAMLSRNTVAAVLLGAESLSALLRNKMNVK